MTKLVDRLIGHTENVEVHDRVTAGPADHVDHPGQKWLDGIAGDDDRPRPHPFGLRCFAQEGPHIAGLVNLVDVGGEGDGDVVSLGRGSLLT